MYASSISTSRISQGRRSGARRCSTSGTNEKKWVWVPDDKDGYLAGWVAREEDEMGEVVMAAGGDVRFPIFLRGLSTGPESRSVGCLCTRSPR